MVPFILAVPVESVLPFNSKVMLDCGEVYDMDCDSVELAAPEDVPGQYVDISLAVLVPSEN